MRVVLGAKGDLPMAKWTYDVSYMFGRTTDAQDGGGQVNSGNVRAALDAVVDPSSGAIVCRDAIARAAGCAPLNIFDLGGITPAAQAWINATVTRSVVIQEQVLSANATGPLVQLPAGAMTLAVGAEERKDSSQEVWDPLTNTGQNGGNALPNVSGAINVREVYAELSVPVLKDFPGFKSLTLDGAYRHGNYSTVGGVNTWKLSVDWAPVQDFRVRAVYSTAIRAPNVGELYCGLAETFPSGFVDPCDGISAASTGATATACKAIPGVSRAIQNGGTFNYSFLDYQNINGFVGSNARLKQETAKTGTFGVVWRPEALRSLSASVDYFDIKINQAVSVIDPQSSISKCLANGAPEFCGNVICSTATGKIITVNQQSINVGAIKTAGIESAVHYKLELPSIGSSLAFELNETHLLQLQQVNFPSAPIQDGINSLSFVDGAGFRDRAVLMTYFIRGPLEVSWTANYMCATNDVLPSATTTVVSTLYNSVPAYTYHDVQVRYSIPFATTRKLDLYGGIKNAFDKQPPFLPSGMASEITGTETAASTYDVVGRYFYAGVNAKF